MYAHAEEALTKVKNLSAKLNDKYPDLILEVLPKEQIGQYSYTFVLPLQKGLNFGIEISLREDDELHLLVNSKIGSFCWLPLSDDALAQDAFIILCALIEGTARIQVVYRGDTYCYSHLQNLENGSWKTVRSHSILGAFSFLFWKVRKQIILHNAS